MIPEENNIKDIEPSQEAHEAAPEKKPRRSLAANIAIIAGCSVGGIVILIILALAAATWWLTPQRLTDIVNREASENLYADVEAHNIRFTIWSSWPHLRLEMDSLTVRSRVFDSIASDLKAQLPPDADFLASSGAFSGGINLLSLLKGEISLRDVNLASLRLNLVALNDSLSNFNIVPPDTVKTKIPYFTANHISLRSAGSIRYRSVPDSADASVAINGLSLSRVEEKAKKRDSYSLKILGNVDAAVGDLSILRGFPFELNGDVALAFKPFRVATSNYRVNLGALHGNIDMKMQVGGDSRLDSFAWHMDNFDLFRILEYIPGMNLSALQSFDVPLTVNATARLTSPWRLSSNVLPSAEVDFGIVDGDMSYTTEDGRSYTLRHEGAGGRLLFDGVNPAASSFVIPPFNITGEGMDLTIGAGMSQLLGEPVVEASLEGEAALKQLAAVFPFLRIYDLKGDMEALALLHAQLPPLSELSSPAAVARSDMEMDGKIRLRNFSGSFEGKKLIASGKSFEFDIDGNSYSGNLPRKINFSGEGEGLTIDIPSKGMKANLKDLKLTGEMDPDASGGKLALGSSGLSLVSGSDNVNLSGISLDLSAERLAKPLTVKDYKVPAEWLADEPSLKTIPHSNPFLQLNLPKEALDFISQWKGAMRMKVAGGVISTPSFPANNQLRNLDITASFDSVVIRNIQLRSRSSAMAMQGSVTNLRQFLCSSTPAPLYVKMDVAMDTVQINQLAGTFMHSRHGAKLSATPDAVQPDDTLSMLLPRNLVTDINASAKETRYTNLHLYDLVTALHLRNGDLRVEDLRIGADFGHAFMNFNFNTSDIQRIGMQADLGLMDIDVVNFFKRFHALLLMMPQMKNLEGELSAEANLSLLAFPNMYVNVPSLNADIRMKGDGLTVHQSPFIRHITRMLLIRENGPLHIADMDVHASIHDNLLELYPFTFSVDRYRLRMGGLNNFNGDLYYHIGVEKSPIPFPFGINVIGQFSHPNIRLGGAHWKIRKGEEITASVMEENMINL
ncbi:MAG: AsmA-like C-terminal region-containing protein, partial [Muribaculaceae bacterium]|nr:AsmA-like C-terminal region-containing protein [Muribaculaceae bacterium]